MYRKQALNMQKKLNEPRNWENLTDSQYKTNWECRNLEFKYFLIYMMKYLKKYKGLEKTEYGFSTENYLKLLNLVKKSLEIGEKTGYYWNIISKQIIQLDLTYYGINRGFNYDNY